MIANSYDKNLKKCFEKRSSKKIRQDLLPRVLRKLDLLDRASSLSDLAHPGLRLHGLRGDRGGRYAISVNGPWRLTFEFHDGHAYQVALEQYH